MGLFENRGWRFVSFNAENFFVYLDDAPAKDPRTMTELEWARLSRSTVDNKQLSKIRDFARAVDDLDPDILMLSEVGGRESLANFSRYFLNDRYVTHLIEGNSDRGIDLGFLVKRSLPLSYDLISHKSRKLDFLYPHEKLSKETGYTHLRSGRVTGHRFSRDVVELRCYAEDAVETVAAGDDNVANAVGTTLGATFVRPEFVLMQVHLKSPLDKDRIDPGGRDRRKAELEMLVTIYQEVQSELPGVPVFISGDFNGTIFGPFAEPEFEAMRESDLRCCLELAEIPQDERFTWMYLNNRRPGLSRQLDYILVPERLRSRVDLENTWVYRFRDESGKYRMIPRNQNEKRTLPSDHYPVVLTIKPELSSTATSNQSSAEAKPKLE